MNRVVNLERGFASFSKTFSPMVVAQLNGQHVKLVHLEGDKVPLHVHEEEDELFFVVEGMLDVLIEGETLTLSAGEFCVVEHGREHRIVPHGHVKLMLFEPAEIAHTGKVRAEITKDEPEWLEIKD